MRETLPSCLGDYPDCFARWRDSCKLLRSTNFGERDCPFYKTTKQFTAEEREAKIRRRKRKARSSCNYSRARKE
jgi:hypothetical protein